MTIGSLRGDLTLVEDQEIIIESSGGVSEEVGEKMVYDAEQYGDEDKAKRESVEV